jgi:hypothetical protein
MNTISNKNNESCDYESCVNTKIVESIEIIRAHCNSNIFIYLYNLLGESAFLLFNDIDFDNDHKKIINFFEFSKITIYKKSDESIYVDTLRSLITKCFTSSSKIVKIALVMIMYSLYDMECFVEFRKQNERFNNTCINKLSEFMAHDDLNCQIQIYIDNLKNMFEINKRYFSISKNKKYRKENNLKLFFVKYISPIKDVEEIISRFLIR